MFRYQPRQDANNYPEGTIQLGRNQIYWIVEQIPGSSLRRWVLYDGPIEDNMSSPRPVTRRNTYLSNELSTSTEETESTEQTESTDSTEPTETTEQIFPDRTLRRSPAFYDLSESTDFGIASTEANPRTVRYNDDDQISYMSFSTDSVTDNDRYSVYDGHYDDIEEIVIDDNQSESDDDTVSTSISEDSDIYSNIVSDESSVREVNENDNILNKCLNDSPVTLSPYDSDDTDELFVIYLKNNQGNFVKGSCLRKDEMRQFLISDKNEESPLSIMAIYKKPTSNKPNDLFTGLTGKPTGKLVVRLPTNNIFITYGSIKRVLDSTNKHWYALPLYGGLPRRIGNLGGIYGSSMHHGQVPGYIIYKLFTKDEIEANTMVIETHDDFPHTRLHNTMLSLFELVGETPLKIFINDIIDDITRVRLVQTNFLEELEHLIEGLNQDNRRRAVYLPRSQGMSNINEFFEPEQESESEE